MEGRATEIAIELEYAKLQDQDPVRFTYAEETAHIEPAHLVGEGTDIVGHGEIHWAGAQDLDMAADGQIDLKLLGMIDQSLSASGLATIHVTLGGHLDEPLPQGSVVVK